MEGRFLKTRNVALVGLTLGVGVLFVGAFIRPIVHAQEECPSPTLIENIDGAGSQQTAPFNTTTDSFRISYNTTADIPEAPFFLTVHSTDPDVLIGPEGSV